MAHHPTPHRASQPRFENGEEALMVFEIDLEAYDLDEIEAAEESWGRGSLTRVKSFS